MADFSTSAAKRPTITIGDVDGVEHPFEVLPFTKSRLDATIRYAKTGKELQARLEAAEAADGTAGVADYAEMQQMMAAAIDDRVRSTNGPITVTSLWQDELIEFKHVRLVGEYLQREAIGDPPA